MNIIATSSMTASDIINAANNIATLNLGYLGISVTIIALLGGAFYLFNIKPFKETLERQEKSLVDLKKEIEENLSSSKGEIKDELKDFEKTHTNNISSLVQQKNEKLISDIHAKMAIFEKDFTEKFDSFATEKDANLKTVLSSEIISQLHTLEKSIRSEMDKTTKEINVQLSSAQNNISSMKSEIVNIKEDTVDLKIEDHLRKNQVGAMKGMIDKLNIRIEKKWNVESEMLMIKNYIIEKGMPKYYLPDLIASFKRVSDDYKAMKDEILRLASDKIFDPI